MKRVSRQAVEVQLIKYPKIIAGILGLCAMLVGAGATWATQMARISELEDQVNHLKGTSVSVEQAATIGEVLKRLENKIDLIYNSVDKRLDNIEKKVSHNE